MAKWSWKHWNWFKCSVLWHVDMFKDDYYVDMFKDGYYVIVMVLEYDH